jgi:hypothetical protein
MRTTGFYTDISGHLRYMASEKIVDQPRTDDMALRTLVARYLAGGQHVSDSPGMLDDAFGSGEQLSLSIHTDGEWVWPADAAFYCERYGILPDPELVKRAQAANGKTPDAGKERALELGHTLFETLAPENR